MLQIRMRLGIVGLSLLVVGAVACGPVSPVPVDPGPPRPVVEHLSHQEILTPLPLRVSLPAKYGAERVLVFFHTWGSTDWGTLELGRRGQTWAGEVSCREVSTVTGDTRYFFLAIDAKGRIVADSGSPEWPHVATIVGKLPDGPQALSGQAPPRKCHDVAQCPPDFPGCPPYALRRPPCETHADCRGSSICAWDHYCAPEKPPEPAIAWELPPSIEEDKELAVAVRRALQKYPRSASR